MDDTLWHRSIRVGLTVRPANGHRIGTVRQLSGTYLVVEREDFVHYPPLEAVLRVDDEAVYLRVSRSRSRPQRDAGRG